MARAARQNCQRAVSDCFGIQHLALIVQQQLRNDPDRSLTVLLKAFPCFHCTLCHFALANDPYALEHLDPFPRVAHGQVAAFWNDQETCSSSLAVHLAVVHPFLDSHSLGFGRIDPFRGTDRVPSICRLRGSLRSGL